MVRKAFHVSEHYDGDKLFTTVDGTRVMTPMLMVMVAIAGTDILFALDSIPAIFGLTQNTFIVFTATAFSLLGLRQLYFLIDGLLDRLIYLSYGLAAILVFIGIKLVLHALHENTLPFVNDGQPVPVVEVSTGLSLSVIIGVLVVTIAASLLSPTGRTQAMITSARHHAEQYLSTTYETDEAIRAKTYQRLQREVEKLHALPEKHRRRIRDEQDLIDLLHRARAQHEARVATGQAPR